MGSFGAKAKKAWAGGIAGAAIGAATYKYAGGSISEEAGKFVGAVAAGFAAGFVAVWFAPKNKTS